MRESRPPSLSRVVGALPATVPFVGPEALERRLGRAFRVRIGANENLFGPSPRATAALSRTAGEIALYGDPEGYELRAALADSLDIRPDHIVLGAGIDELLGLLVRAYLDEGEAVALSTGGYATFLYHAVGHGGRIVGAPYREFRNDPLALAEAARRHEARILYLSNPDNPTGSWLSRTEQEALVAALPPGCLLILDEAYIEFAPPQDWLPVDAHDAQVVRLRTFSKAHGMAGARIGYVIGAPETVQPLERIRNHFGINRPALAAAQAALGDRDYIKYVAAEVAQGRTELAALAAELGLRALPSAANFVALDLGTAERAAALLAALIEREAIFVRRPGIAPLDRLVRVSIGPAPVRRVFAEALPRALARI